ncbi:MurR/RpiR family transcriptional regulator [Verminephrobacter aporrectodeae subsp. tuberculatae]|uniref:MurR/RpiR family transcriptional regulator n=1 Tax=Verminephrobacter aporrectodeae TaxID=1110389 RepID=UPI0022382ECF|nr:MurR/RpiR family transcriptional regulator [Verminephrobacter aporrectodeae]MCW5223611.1 MurR/RpiR family transcriptional regulator [Verminephrobacter aporrectodeae subsp. tuberculatae]MCW5289076.1 MurR/RpiR family transcriptional regulator [Verminephrobacter aporrectodeae subsp. tuberculatae]MCW8169307.1 MurR/RpiR family transcriptional regulator [Verminephrobacter aporrectodeae subsp. tuberculatae]
MKPPPPPPESVEQFLHCITQEYDGLSRQLKVISRHVEAHRDQLGLEGIQSVAGQCGVQPSAMVRFAKRFGFSGFSEMQRLFREGLAEQIAPGRAYKLRLRELIESGSPDLQPEEIADEFIKGSIAGMQQLRQTLDQQDFARAVELLANTQAIWIAGSRRSFPVAVYLDYALQHTEKRIGLLNALGSMQQGQIRSVRAGDTLIAISFAPYAEETVQLAQQARQRGARLIAITDSRMGPIAGAAEACLIVQDSATFGFRALTAAMGLAQSLFVALAYRLELSSQSGDAGRRSGSGLRTVAHAHLSLLKKAGT